MNTLLVLLALMVILSILIAIYIYFNRESTHSADVLSKVLIAILVALLIIGIDLIKKVPSDYKRVQVLILRNNETVEVKDFTDKLLSINSSINCYSLFNEVNLFSRKNEELNSSDDKTLDLLESSLWVWLSKAYHIHWEVDQIYFAGISGGGGNIKKSKDAEDKFATYGLDSLIKHLGSNYYEISSARFWGVSLPLGSKVKYFERDSHERTFLIKNNHVEFRIKIYRVGSSGLNFTKLGENILTSLSKYYENSADFYSDNFIVEFTCEYSRWLKGSPLTQKQRKWVNEIMDNFYDEFDWEKIKPDLEKVYNK